MIWAHRGGSIEHPENTLEAFKSLPTDVPIETDVVCCKDQVVVSHDRQTTRLTLRSLQLNETLFKDLPAYKDSIGVEFGPDTPTKAQNHQYCTLEQLFKILHTD